MRLAVNFNSSQSEVSQNSKCTETCTRTFYILVAFTVIASCVSTWKVPPAGVVELPAEILAESRQVRLPVWHLIQVRRVEQHLGIGGAARTLDLLQQTSTFGVVGGENLRTTHNKDC